MVRTLSLFLFFFFFNDTATTEIYTLSLHDALPICCRGAASTSTRTWRGSRGGRSRRRRTACPASARNSCARRLPRHVRSEEHTSELQSLAYLVCRLLLEKKK